MLECGFESHLGLEFSGFSMWHFLKLVVSGFLCILLFPPLLHQLMVSAVKLLRNNGYDPQKDQINTLDRRTQTTIFRLRTGHCGLRKHLKRLGLADSAHCECGSEEQTLSTFFRPAHTWRQYANSFGQKTLKWAPSSGGKLPNYSGRRTS